MNAEKSVGRSANAEGRSGVEEGMESIEALWLCIAGEEGEQPCTIAEVGEGGGEIGTGVGRSEAEASGIGLSRPVAERWRWS